MHVSQANIFIHDSDEVQSLDYCCHDHNSDFGQLHHFSLVELAPRYNRQLKDECYGDPPAHPLFILSFLESSRKCRLKFRLILQCSKGLKD